MHILANSLPFICQCVLLLALIPAQRALAAPCSACPTCTTCFNGAAATGNCQSQPSRPLLEACTSAYCSSKCLYCFYGSYALADTCTPCPVNTYQPTTLRVNLDISGCLPCPSGTVTFASGASACSPCTPCSPGNYTYTACQPTQDTVCNLCPAGFNNTNASATACTACPSGYYQPASGQSSCIPCPSGKYQPSANATTCIACTPGKYSPINASSICTPCQPGTIQPNASSTFCLSCTPGKYSPNVLNSTCTSCTPGSYQPASNTTYCLACPSGTIQPNASSSFCLSCTPGKYSPNVLNSTCTSCTPGSYQPASNTTSCLACPSGTIQPNASSSSCLTCTLGTYAASVTDSACTPCPPGTYQPNASATACTACPAGLYQPASSTTSCLACMPGQYQPLPAHTACLACPLGTFQPYNASSSCNSCPACPSGSFLASGCDGTYNATCNPCSTCQPIITNNTTNNSNSYTPFQTQSNISQISQNIYTPCSAFSDTVCGTDNGCPVIQSSSKYSWMLDGSIDPSTIACRAGQYLSGLNPKTCISCPAWLVGLNGIYCEPCGPLQAPYSVDQASCVCVPPSTMNSSGVCVCPDGYYTDANACMPCPINSYGTSGSCSPCPPGYYSQSTATTCTACDAGMYRALSDLSCQSCDAGMYSPTQTMASCTQCNTSCPDGYRADPCPGEPNTTYMVCSPCPPLPDNSVWDSSTACGYKCNQGHYRGNQSCPACSVTRCEPGYNLTQCTEFANGNCDTACQDDTKPRLFSQWTSGCSWSCNQGYSLRVTDYWIFKINDCVPG